MKNYENIIIIGIIIFPIIAFLMTLPYMIRQYHKYGSIPFFRTFIIYSFILYLLIAYFQVILPLPSMEYVESLNTKWVQLRPFNFIRDIINSPAIHLRNPRTYLSALKNPLVYVPIFNVLLTIPFGVYLRYYFKRKWWQALLLAILLCSFFELTQLSGLYGIYPRPYRLFDVDDFIQNTTGAMIGFWITPLISFFLPSRDSLDEKAYEKGKRVSFIRRLTALIIDMIIINSIILILAWALKLNIDIEIHALIIMYIYILESIIFNGTTIGKKCVKIRLTNQNGEKAKVYQIAYRYIIMYFIFIILPKFIIEIPNTNDFYFVIQLALLIVFIGIILKITIEILQKKEQILYDKITKTKHISTIKHNIEEN